MHTITRNNKNNKKGKHLLFPFNGHIYISVRNAKLLCGYSETTGNEVILNKVSSKNLICNPMFSKKETIIENYFLNHDGFAEVVDNLTQKDKKQNGELALKMINEAYYDLNSYIESKYGIKAQQVENSVEEQPVAINTNTMTSQEMVDEIKRLVGDYSEETKPRWKKLYDTIDEVLEESIRKSHQRYKRDNNINLSILDYVRKETQLLPYLYEIAVRLYA